MGISHDAYNEVCARSAAFMRERDEARRVASEATAIVAAAQVDAREARAEVGRLREENEQLRARQKKADNWASVRDLDPPTRSKVRTQEYRDWLRGLVETNDPSAPLTVATFRVTVLELLDMVGRRLKGADPDAYYRGNEVQPLINDAAEARAEAEHQRSQVDILRGNVERLVAALLTARTDERAAVVAIIRGLETVNAMTVARLVEQRMPPVSP